MDARLIVDDAEIATFVSDLFRYAGEGEFVSLRGFHQLRRDVPPVIIRACRIERDFSTLIAEAVLAASKCADALEPAVFAPPICTFANAEHARVVDLASGLVLSVEVDDVDPDAARATLESLLGPATVVVSSGSEWIDIETGQVKPKIHIHWRLNESTTDIEGHQRLRQARDLAARLVGADPTGKPVVHPLRWPGSWNRKGTPRMARIVARNPDAEVDLSDALDRLGEAIEAAGLGKSDIPVGYGNPQAPIQIVASAMAVIPNPRTDVHYSDWIRLGYAANNATGGSVEGFVAWDTWSQKSEKYNGAETEAAWRRIAAAITGTNAPSKIGAGTIFFLAKQAGWERPSPFASGDEEAPPDISTDADEGSPDAADAPDPVNALMAEFNARYMVVNEAGKTVIYEPAHDALLNRSYHVRMAFEDFKRLYLNRRVRIGPDGGGEAATARVANVWLTHPLRRQFIGGIIFDPSSRPGRHDTLNLWQGFAVTPLPGSWARLKHHILHIVCCGNQQHFTFLMCWMARLVQYPAEQGEVAVVMRGGEGTGKGTLARALHRLLGQHGLAISNSKHLTGNFNGHLRDTVFLFADEAFFAGDRAHVGILKTLITEPYLTIEAKYQNAVQMPNFVHLMMASNEDWVVPASMDARRFFVLEVSADRANDHAYFGAIWEEMEAGGYEAMLHDLLHHNLSGFNPRSVPVTTGLQTQRKLSLPTAEDWWMEVLQRGYVFKSRLGLEEHFSQWHDQITTEVLCESYAVHARAKSEHHPMGREALGKFMVRIGAKPVRPRHAVVGEHITDVNTGFGGTMRKAALIQGDRPHGFHLGSLAAARADFQKSTALQVDWPSDEDDAP